MTAPGADPGSGESKLSESLRYLLRSGHSGFTTVRLGTQNSIILFFTVSLYFSFVSDHIIHHHGTLSLVYYLMFLSTVIMLLSLWASSQGCTARCDGTYSRTFYRL